MIKIVRTTMKKKIAGIITESGVIDFFEILCGVAHGDSPSGLIFILALEPLALEADSGSRCCSSHF